MSQGQIDRRDNSMLEKFLDLKFSNLEEKIKDLKGQDVAHYNELKTQISNMREEVNTYQKKFNSHLVEEYPHEKCKENSDKIDEIKKVLDAYLKSVNDKQQYNKGLQKGIYLSATTLKYLLWGAVGAVGTLYTFWDTIKGFIV